MQLRAPDFKLGSMALNFTPAGRCKPQRYTLFHCLLVPDRKKAPKSFTLRTALSTPCTSGSRPGNVP